MAGMALFLSKIIKLAIAEKKEVPMSAVFFSSVLWAILIALFMIDIHCICGALEDISNTLVFIANNMKK